jgi:hypothetical protein
MVDADQKLVSELVRSGLVLPEMKRFARFWFLEAVQWHGPMFTAERSKGGQRPPDGQDARDNSMGKMPMPRCALLEKRETRNETRNTCSAFVLPRRIV